MTRPEFENFARQAFRSYNPTDSKQVSVIFGEATVILRRGRIARVLDHNSRTLEGEERDQALEKIRKEWRTDGRKP